ncbi:Na+/H+ antiporter subunit E [Chungangia koreensis]|uniref:Na+/H+ antiporter subunit E n=1 Tax=Chungangia koreensis TaxID=752657 RepID=A0ABV8X9Q1_9LACT
MAIQILLNFFVAVVWTFITGTFTAHKFIIGWLIGAILLFLMRRFLSERFYFARIWSMVKLIILFLKELILSNIAVMKLVLEPTLPVSPAIFAYPTELRSDWEITLLSVLITLTPGTLVIDVSEDQKTLFIHAIHADEIDEAISSIKNTFEKAIMEVSRS